MARRAGASWLAEPREPGSRAMLAMRRPHRHDRRRGRSPPMRVAVVNETSAVDKHPAILAALDGRGLGVVNAGMAEQGEDAGAAVHPHGAHLGAAAGGRPGRHGHRRLWHRPGLHERRRAVPGHRLRPPADLARRLPLRAHQRRQRRLAGAQPGLGLGRRREPAPPLRPALHGRDSGRGTRPIARRPNERPASGCSSSRRPPIGPWRRSWRACPTTSSSRP